MVCKGSCSKYKVTIRRDKGIYKRGYKKCSICEIFIKWDGLFCPCCNYKLRNKPRNPVCKERLNNELKVRRI